MSSDLYWLMAFASNHSLDTGYRTVNAFIHERLPRQKRLTRKHHAYAREHVIYQHGDYRDAPDIEATWFIDPPYQGLKHGYREGGLDYEELAEWCIKRKGQRIVCEGAFANWLPFEFHAKLRGIGNAGQIVEHVWTSDVTVCRCGTRFRPTRAGHTFCSGRCRAAGWRNATA